MGLKCRKIGHIPEKSLTEEKLKEQHEFKEQELDSRYQEALEGKRVLLFMDAAHFIFKAFLGFVWCFQRLFIPSPSGRKRFNVLGAVNIVTKEIITITNETYINAESVCQLLIQIANLYGKIPITIVLDNARYQRCKLVQEFAKTLNIELLFLPSYSPNLNLIERLWRFVKKECLYSKYYHDFDQFKTAINNCIHEAQTDKKHKLDSLLNWKFQFFEKEKILTV